MARVQVFESGGIQPQSPEVTPFRAPDFGPGIGPGVDRLGQAVGEAAQKAHEIAEVGSRIEANKLSIAYNNLGTAISEQVRSAQGENAEAAANKGMSDLEQGQSEILRRASPRARVLLEQEFAQRTNQYRQQWWEHGFEEKKSAFDTSAQAANDGDRDAALRQSTDDAARPYLDSIKARNHQRATFFGLGRDWEDGENRKYTSNFYRERAASLGVNSAYDAIHYALQHRGDLSGDDFDSVIRSYSDEAMRERAASMVYGAPMGSDPPLPSDTPVDQNGAPAPVTRADPATVFRGLIIRNEGTAYVAHDSNGYPVRYGINQKYHPNVDLKKLTMSGAEKIFEDEYWIPSGADKLPPALAVVHADTYYLNKIEATKILRESGGDVQRYIEMRNNFLARLHASNPGKYPDYTSRNERVESYASAVGGDGTPFSFAGRVGPRTPMEPVEREIMQRTDIPLRLRTAIVQMVREDRNSQREDLKMKEEDARDTLIASATNLDAGFTSIKQLPHDALASASPETIASLTRLAKTNRYKKDDAALVPEVNYTEFTNPQRFMSADYVQHLMSRGASPGLITKVRAQQAELMRRQMSAKPYVISDGTLWSIARPAFVAAGIGVDTTKATTPTLQAQKKEGAAQLQQQAVLFLQNLATTWEQENPGKRPTPEIMRQWVGSALLQTHPGQRAFQASDQDIYNSIQGPLRDALVRGLRRHGDTATGPLLVRHVAGAWRQMRSLYGTKPHLDRYGSFTSQSLQGVSTGSGLPDIDMSDVDYGGE